MSELHRLRIELPDRPGALAQAAAVIGQTGANVVSLDIHELESETAVDEIVVEAPDGWQIGELVTALAGSEAILLSSAPVREARDPVIAALEWSAAIVAAGAHESELELGRCILELTSASAAWVCDVPQALRYDVGRLALERAAPVVQRTTEPPEWAPDLPPSVWLLAVPDDDLMPSLVAFAARPLTVRFTASEIARVEALMELRRSLSIALGGVAPRL